MSMKAGIYWSRDKFFHVRDVKGDDFTVDIYRVQPGEGTTAKSTQKMNIGRWANTLPFSQAIEADEDTMQGLIQGIFEKDD